MLLKYVAGYIYCNLRLCHFYSTGAKVNILENVTTGQIKEITKACIGERRELREVVTTPAASFLGNIL